MNRNVIEEIVQQAFTSPTVPRKPLDLTPKQVIFNPPATIVYWPDGDKTVVRCDNDEFSEEFGYAMACMRKIYGTRAEFKAQFKNAFRPQEKSVKTKKAKADVAVQHKSSGSHITLDKLLRDLAGNDSIGVQIAFRHKDV